MKVQAAQASLKESVSSSTRPSREEADAQRARNACREFESILIYRMLSAMRKAFDSKEKSESGFGGGIFKSMMDEQLSIALAKAGGIGLSGLLERGLGLDARKGESPVEADRLSRILHRPNRVASVGAVESDTPSRVRGKLRPYDSIIRAAAKVFGLSADLIGAVIIQESGGDSKAVSSKGAKGLMQLTDATARELGVTDPFDSVQNIFGGARLLAGLLQIFEGDLKLALASYNAGIGVVRRYGGIPPFKETQEYIRKVTRYLEGLRAR